MNVSHSAKVGLLDVFLIVFGQWSSVAQRTKLYQALDTRQYSFVRTNSLLVLDFSLDVFTITKNTENRWHYPFKM